jgi:hypothetical protein
MDQKVLASGFEPGIDCMQAKEQTGWATGEI